MLSPLLCRRGSAAQSSGIDSNPITVSGSISVCRIGSSLLTFTNFESSQWQNNGTFEKIGPLISQWDVEHLKNQSLRCV